MLQVIDLEKKYGDKTILDKVNFGLEKGQIKALVGPNGSGKTTLMNSISNSIKIDGGKIVIDNEEYDDEKIFNKLTFFRDETILDFNMKGIDYLELIKNAYKKSTEDVNNICKKYEIEGFAHKRVGEYSLGMKKKVNACNVFLAGKWVCFIRWTSKWFGSNKCYKNEEFIERDCQTKCRNYYIEPWVEWFGWYKSWYFVLER